jgi:hypothetical protein
MLAAFRVRSYRFQWPGDLLTSWAFEMETLILGWYVLVETGSVTLLAALGALQYLGTFIAPFFGLAGDRIGRRSVLCVMRATYALMAITMMGFGLSGTLTPYHVFAIVFLVGLVRPSDLVMRNSLIGDTMPRHSLMNALGFSRATQDSAKIAGALAGAGLLSALGMGVTYVAIAGFYLASLAFTFGVSKTRPSQTPDGDPTAQAATPTPWRDLINGLTYAWETPNVRMVLWLAFLVNLTAVPLTTGLLPYVVKDLYLMDANGLGRLTAVYAGGALTGSLLLAWAGGSRRPAMLMFLCAASWYALLLWFGQISGPGFGAWALAGIGFFHSATMVTMGVALIGWTAPLFRGRVMGARSLAVMGVPIGLIASGPIIEATSFQATLYVYCAIGITTIAWLFVKTRNEI